MNVMKEGVNSLVVLIVDDDIFNLKVADGYIKTNFPDFCVLLCQKPKEVMDLLENEHVDIILLDIMMPQVSGIDLLKEIRMHHEYREIQVLMLTALDNAESFSECFEMGANDFLRKPIDIVEFRARIKSAAMTRYNILVLKELNAKMKLQNDEIRVINSQLKDTQFHLIQSEKLAAIGELAAGVAHEINNPIGYVGSNLETMEGYLKKMQGFIDSTMQNIDVLALHQEDPAINELKEAIRENYKKFRIDYISEDLGSIIMDSREGVQKVTEIVKSLRNFARTGNEDEKAYCTVREMIDQALLIVRNEAKYNVLFTVNSLDDDEMFCHKGQISQVFLNIVLNAIQAIKTQDRLDMGKISISVYKQNEYICIRIEDDGPGIQEEHLSKIFSPFFTTKDVGQGTGLGLSISHDIVVKNHGGIIEVESTVGVGTAFMIKIPKNEAEEVLYARLDE